MHEDELAPPGEVIRSLDQPLGAASHRHVGAQALDHVRLAAARARRRQEELRHDMLVAADQTEGIADAARRGGERGAKIGDDLHLVDAAAEAHRGGKIDQSVDRDRRLLLEAPDIERPDRVAHTHAEIDAARVRDSHQRIEIAEEAAGPLNLAAMSADADCRRRASRGDRADRPPPGQLSLRLFGRSS